MKVIEYFSKQSKSFIVVVGFLLVVFIGIVDYLTGAEISLSIFYLLPISLVAWFTGKWRGFVVSVASGVTWLAADLATGHIYSHPVIPYWNMTVRLGFFLIVTFTLHKLKIALVLERALARTDSLTGIANGRTFDELANSEINRARRYRHPFTLAYIDLDNFKTVNDHFGHTTGDTLLQLVAKIIQDNLRAVDIVARLGGDEFAILLPETEHEPGQVVIRRIQKNLLDIMQKNGWPVTFSIGMVTFISPLSTVDEMIKMADDLMYSVKSSGKNELKHEVFDQYNKK